MKTSPLFVLSSVLLLGVGCPRKDSGAPDAAGHVASASASTAASASASVDPDEVRPVYPLDVATDPLAKKLCEALHDVQEDRRATCCKEAKALVLTGECVRNLSGALAAKAVTIDAAEVQKCAEAAAATYAGCDWVGPFPPKPPAACLGIVHGTVGAGATCRSSLECTGNMHCHGSGPTQGGRCTAGAPDGVLCNASVDVLIGYTRQTDAEQSHRECSGYCNLHNCATAMAAGAKCEVNVQCGAGSFCIGGKCGPGTPGKVGEACPAGACEGAARCIHGKCIARKAAGEPCEVDLECLGGCVKKAGEKTGTCGMRCDVR